MPRRLLSAAAACTLLLGLAACGEGSEGTVTTPPPSIDIEGPSDGGGDGGASDAGGEEESPSAAPDVPAPDPADYAGMDENTPEGAQQFTRYFFALLIWGYQTGEYSKLEELYGPSCTICEANVQTVREFNQKDEYWSNVEVEDIALRDLPVADNEYEAAVHYEARVSKHVEPASDGGPAVEAPPLHFKFQTGLRWDGDRWIIEGSAMDLESVQ